MMRSTSLRSNNCTAWATASQVDLPPGQTSGLAEATRLLRNVEGIGHVVYTAEDVIRHELVARIVDAYDKAALKAARSRETKE